jgi:DNA-binding Lrp family transcriptional regulator
MESWIKLHRRFLDWEWYSCTNTKILFLHLILKANYENKKWRGERINRGQLFTSIRHMAMEVGISEKAIRNSLKKLEKTSEIIVEGASHGTMITICKYDTYQDNGKAKGEPKGKQGANKGQARGEQRATTKESKNIKNIRSKENKVDFLKNLKFISQDENLKNVFSDFHIYRLEIRKPLTQKAAELMDSKLEKISEKNFSLAAEILQQSMMNNWTGIFPVAANNQKNNQNNQNNDRISKEQTRNDAAKQAFIRLIAKSENSQ